MADSDATITFELQLDDGSIKKVTANVEQLAEKLGGALGSKVGDGLDKSFTGLAVQLQFVAKIADKAFSAISGVIGSAIHEAIQADQALQLFNATLANSGKYSAEASADFVAFAASLQNVGTVSDDAVISAANSLVSIGKLSGDSLKKATQASVDLSVGLGVDLNSAFDLVSKAAAGNTAALGRYGIKIQEGLPKSERFAAVLGEIEKRFQGLDAAKANTFGGALTQLGNNFRDVYENIGKLFTQSPALVAVFKFLSESFKGLAEKIGVFGKSGDALRPTIEVLLSIGRVLSQNVLPIFELMLNVGKALFNALLTGFSSLGTAVSLVASTVASALASVGVVSKENADALNANYQSNKEAMIGLANQTAESFSQITEDFSISAGVDNYLADVQRAVDQSVPIQEQMKNNMKATGDQIISSLALTAQKLGQIVNSGLANAISQGVQVVVSNLAKGKNAFDGFLKAIFGIFGDMAITIGTTLIAAGLGMEALRASIVGMTGGPALFAGIALVAVGTLLKALSGGGGGPETATTTQTAGPGGVAPPPDVTSITEQPPADRNRKTEVAVNIQGNVLDRRETGLEIASVLQEFFDKQDGVLVRG